jgi:hypothetical protein
VQHIITADEGMTWIEAHRDELMEEWKKWHP